MVFQQNHMFIPDLNACREPLPCFLRKPDSDASLSFSPIPRPERLLMALLRVDPDRRTTAAGCELIVKSGRNCLDGGAPDFRHRGAAFIGAPGAKLVSCFLRCRSRSCSLEHYMPKLNPALFDSLTRIENACRRASNIMLTAPDPPRENEMVLREIQEIREA